MLTRIPLRHLPRVVWRRIRREVQQRTAPRTPRPLEIDGDARQLARRFRERQAPRFFDLSPRTAALVAGFFPEVRRATLEQAEAIRAHRFDLLGSGERDLGPVIGWHTDFKSGHTWPLEHYTRLTLTSPEGGFDVKVPWELSRFHHAVRLGQAYLYTGDEAYAREIVAQVGHWIEANPCEFGVNWAGPMDVAIRAVNWIWALYAIRASEALEMDFLARWLASLRQHGRYLVRNLEDGWPRTNHLIADLTGLAYLGILFPEFPEARRWRSVGLSRLWRELERQVYSDGVSYEASLSYHRLVAEMALSVAALCVLNGIGVPARAQARLRRMLDVIAACTQPDGLTPQIGDADDGRLHILTVHPDRTRIMRDHRHLLALGAAVLGHGDIRAGPADSGLRGWISAAGPEWQDALWCFPSGVAPRLRELLAEAGRADETSLSRGFEQGGLYVLRQRDFHLTVDAGSVGQEGVGGHAHNDTLSLTLCAYGRTFLIDPGSFLYTSDPAARNAFRSTAYHNVLQINDEEINRLPERELFHLPPDARVTVHRWLSTPAYDLFDASHDGYRRLRPAVIHRRRIWFDRTLDLWLLREQLLPVDASGAPPDEPVRVTLWFHFAPLPIRLDETRNAAYTETDSGPNLVILPPGEFPLRVALDEGWYAPRYGVRERVPVVKFTGRVKLPADMTLVLYPCQGQPDRDRAHAAGLAAVANFLRALASPGD